MLSKKQPWRWPLTFEKKIRASNDLAKHRNELCKTRHNQKSASLKLVQLAPRSFCHAADGISEQSPKSNFSRGEWPKTCSRSAAPSVPLVSLLKHLEWSKGDCGAAGRWQMEKNTFMPCRPQSYKKLVFVGGTYYHLHGAIATYMVNLEKILARLVCKTKVVRSNEMLDLSKLLEGTAKTRNMDLGQNILEKSQLIFFEAKASWVHTRLAH